MTSFSTIKKACIPCFGFEHRDLAARFGAMKYIIERYLDGDLGANLLFGFETIHNTNLVSPSILDATHKLLKENEVTQVLAGLRTNSPSARLQAIDYIVTHHMVRQCKEYGLSSFQLDSDKITNQMDKDIENLSILERKNTATKYDEIRTQAMLDNITQALSSQNKNSFCILFVGMGHLPLLTTRIPKILSDHNINAKTTSLSLVSDQGMREINPNIKYPQHQKVLEQSMESFVMNRMLHHKDYDHQEIITSLRNNDFTRFNENGDQLDKIMQNKIDYLIKFMNEKETTLNPEASKLQKEKGLAPDH